ncbi:MAG: hypothetical protein ABI036_11815 [Fibrobacteria bacterium]
MKSFRTQKNSIGMAVAIACSFTDTGAFFVDGYWARKNDPDPYERYVRIENDSGFYCVLDDKSSFRFQVIGDSITTPMNGKNAIFWFPGSGDIMISGEEKGEAYNDRFGEIDSSTYYNNCRAEESASAPVEVLRPGKRKNGKIKLRPRINILGKKDVSSSHSR